jgi:hypothetical protein
MALKILFGSDIGLLSLATIGFVVLMAVFFVWFFTSNIRKGQKK